MNQVQIQKAVESNKDAHFLNTAKNEQIKQIAESLAIMAAWKEEQSITLEP